MWLDYIPFLPLELLAYSRSDPASFQCILPDNPTKGIHPDRVIANSDGALSIKTDKMIGIHRRIWDKQKSALAFEVTRYSWTSLL